MNDSNLKALSDAIAPVLAKLGGTVDPRTTTGRAVFRFADTKKMLVVLDYMKAKNGGRLSFNATRENGVNVLVITAAIAPPALAVIGGAR